MTFPGPRSSPPPGATERGEDSRAGWRVGGHPSLGQQESVREQQPWHSGYPRTHGQSGTFPQSQSAQSSTPAFNPCFCLCLIIFFPFLLMRRNDWLPCRNNCGPCCTPEGFLQAQRTRQARVLRTTFQHFGEVLSSKSYDEGTGSP